MGASEPWELGIADAAALIREGELSAVELLTSVLGRIEETEEYAQAWVHVDAEGAMAAARAADREPGTGPLLGVPVAVKDVIDVRGLPTEGGSEALRGHIAQADASAVARLRTSGAVILGKLQTHEFAFGQGTPPTRNPWDPERYAGGSSVGSGVAVAVGSVPGALGTDTGGSVRNPAAVNGLVGLKPSTGLVDGSGVLTVSHSLDHIGPIARSVADCALLLEGMLSEAALARIGGPFAERVERSTAPARLAVDPAAWDSCGVHSEVRGLVEAALACLEGLGFEIVEIGLPELDFALPASLAVSLSEAAEHHRALLRQAARDYLPGTRVMIETGALVTREDLRLAGEVRAYLRDLLARAFDRTGTCALLAPTLPAVAPLEAQMSHELTGSTDTDSLASALRMLSPANLLGLPAVSVPCGLASGQPVGLHIMGREFHDARVLGIARAYEAASRWSSLVPVVKLPARVP